MIIMCEIWLAKGHFHELVVAVKGGNLIDKYTFLKKEKTRTDYSAVNFVKR